MPRICTLLHSMRILLFMLPREWRNLFVPYRFFATGVLFAAFCLFVFVSVLLFSAGKVYGAESRPITVLLDDAPSVDQTGFLVAKELGLYKKAGLEKVEFRWNEGDEDPFRLFSENSIDFAVFWMAEGIVARTRNIPVAAIALLSHGTGACFITRSDLFPNIRDLRSFQTRKILLWGCCTVTPKSFLSKKGIAGQFINQRSNASMLFSTGGTDILFSTLYDTVVMYKYLEFRDSIKMFAFSNYGCTYPETTLFCRDSLLKTDPELCRRFALATYEGWKRTFSNPEEAIRILVRYCKKAGTFQDAYILKEQLQAWQMVMQLRMPLERNGGCPKDRFDILCRDMIEGKLIVASKCPAYDEFFQHIFADKTALKKDRIKTNSSPVGKISKEGETK